MHADDVYGTMLLDYLEGREAWEVIERDDGHLSLGPGPLRYFAAYKDWRPAEREAMEYARGRVLDIGCGAGRHMLHLRRLGYQTIGIDSSPGVADVCARQGLIDVHVTDLDSLDGRFGPFNTVLMLGLGSGFFGNIQRGKRILVNLHSITSDDGLILAGNGSPHSVMDDESSQEYMRRNIAEGKPEGYRRVRIRYRSYATPWFDILRLSDTEMNDLINDTGWTMRNVIREESSYYVGVLEKA